MLSGGERNRVAMVKVLLQNANFLLLDEPTNHLDLYAKSVLLQALKQYTGTIFFVSHDHQFIQELATDIAELTPQGLFYYPGSYEAYLDEKKQKEKRSNPQQRAQSEQKQEKVHSKETQKNIRTLEQQIQKLEKKIDDATIKLAAIANDYEQYQKRLATINTWQKELDATIAEWEQLLS